jgi:hypothetical protein
LSFAPPQGASTLTNEKRRQLLAGAFHFVTSLKLLPVKASRHGAIASRRIACGRLT